MSSCSSPAHSPDRSFCANAEPPANRKSARTNAEPLALDRTSIHVNPSDVYEATPPVSASRHQIGEADLVHFAQVRLLDPPSGFRRFLPLRVDCRDGRDVELQPADRGDRKLRLDEVFRIALT